MSAIDTVLDLTASGTERNVGNPANFSVNKITWGAGWAASPNGGYKPYDDTNAFKFVKDSLGNAPQLVLSSNFLGVPSFATGLNLADDLQVTYSGTAGGFELRKGKITGTKGMIVNGSGDTATSKGLWLTNSNNDFSGGITLQTGKITFGVDSSTRNTLGTGTVILANGTSFYSGSSQWPVVTNPITIQGNVTLGVASNGTGRMELSGQVDLAGGTRTATVNYTDASTVWTKISGKITNGGLKLQATAANTNPQLFISGINNDYALGTEILNGHMEVTAGSSLGTGNVTITGGKLRLDGNTMIADTKTLTIPSSGNRLRLDFTGNEVVGKLVVGTTEFTSGVYNKSSGTINGINFANVFDATSTGSIAIPEPGSVAGLLASGALMALRRKRRS